MFPYSPRRQFCGGVDYSSDHGGLLGAVCRGMLLHRAAPMAGDGSARAALRPHPHARLLPDARHGTPLFLL